MWQGAPCSQAAVLETAWGVKGHVGRFAAAQYGHKVSNTGLAVLTDAVVKLLYCTKVRIQGVRRSMTLAWKLESFH